MVPEEASPSLPTTLCSFNILFHGWMDGWMDGTCFLSQNEDNQNHETELA